MTVPRRTMFRPKWTSPETVRWSSSTMWGICLKRFWNCWTWCRTSLSWGKEVWGIIDQTFLKCPLSLITGGTPNIRFSFMTKRPCSKTKRSLFTKSRSEEFFTGRNRERGTSMPWAFLKCFTAEPAAVSILKSIWKSAKHRRRDPDYLNHWSPIVQHFRIGNDVQLHFAILQDALQGFRNMTVVNNWGSSKNLVLIYL